MSVLVYKASNSYIQVRVEGKTFIEYMMTKGFIIVPHSIIKGA